MGESCVRTSTAEGVAEVWLERPPLNVLDTAMMRELLDTLGRLGREPALRLVVLGSAQKAFSAGVEVGEHRGDLAGPMIRTFHHLLVALASFPVPTMAVVGGAALGGGFELALACDLRLCAAEAKLGLPEITLGVFPPYAALRLPELCGSGAAARLVLTGETIDGNRAHALGLVDQVVPRSGLGEASAALVESFRGKSAAALKLAKEALRLGRGEHASRLAAIESLYLGPLMSSHDAEEGLGSFLEKRSPRWLHR